VAVAYVVAFFIMLAVLHWHPQKIGRNQTPAGVEQPAKPGH